MPIDLTISNAVTPDGSPDRTQTQQASQTFQPVATTTAEPKAAGPPPPSPTLRFDASADMLVIEFHNDAGAVTDSIPTQQQLEAYRSHAEYGPPPASQPAPPHPAASVATVASSSVASSSPGARPDIAT